MDVMQIPVQSIRRDPSQVRKVFNKDRIAGLARSMEEVGLLHPILVKEAGDGYQLIAGERRLRAAKTLGLATMAAIVLKPGTPVKQVQLVENLQREDLNPVERALAVKEFMDMDKLSKVAAAKRLGIPRTTLTDWLDVLDVDERYQRALVDNFNGGDSPLTLSHVAEGRALATRLRSPAICNVLLDAALEYKLSKVETREICAIVRENADVSIEDAVKLVRRPADVAKLPKEAEDERQAVERNIERWVAILERSTDTLAQLRRVAPYYLPEGERERLVNRLEELKSLVDAALVHIVTDISMPVPAVQAEKKKRPKKAKVS